MPPCSRTLEQSSLVEGGYRGIINIKMASVKYIADFKAPFKRERSFLNNMEEEWTFLVQAADDIEAGIICGLLQEASITAQKKDGDPLVGFMRVVGGQSFAIDIFVPQKELPRARSLLENIFRKQRRSK